MGVPSGEKVMSYPGVGSGQKSRRRFIARISVYRNDLRWPRRRRVVSEEPVSQEQRQFRARAYRYVPVDVFPASVLQSVENASVDLHHDDRGPEAASVALRDQGLAFGETLPR